MLNFVSKDRSRLLTGASPEERNYDLSAFMPIPLQNNRYLFSVSLHGLPQEFAFDPFLFLREDHLITQSEDDLLLFQLLDQKTDKIVAHLPFFVNDSGLAYSPGKAPFGSVQFKFRLQENVLWEFLELVKRYLLEQEKCRTIQLKSYPFAYAPAESALLTDMLLKQGFEVLHSEINHHIEVDELPVAGKMDAASRRRLNKYERQGFSFSEETLDFLPEAYRFIIACREEKGYRFSISLPELSELFNRFPDNFRIFSVKQNNALAAVTIAVKINERVCYNFSLASSLAFKQYSPAIFLVAGLYNVCQQEGIRILDLGTSNLPTGPNYPLIAFKKHLGGKSTLKLTFQLST